MNSFELDERIDKDLKQYIIDRENKRQDLNLETRFGLFVSSFILVAIGVFIGNNFNTNSYSLNTQKHTCEKSLPRDKVCVLESYNFTIKSK